MGPALAQRLCFSLKVSPNSVCYSGQVIVIHSCYRIKAYFSVCALHKLTHGRNDTRKKLEFMYTDSLNAYDFIQLDLPNFFDNHPTNSKKGANFKILHYAQCANLGKYKNFHHALWGNYKVQGQNIHPCDCTMFICLDSAFGEFSGRDNQ